MISQIAMGGLVNQTGVPGSSVCWNRNSGRGRLRGDAGVEPPRHDDLFLLDAGAELGERGRRLRTASARAGPGNVAVSL
jgi:hypothetical protein